MPRQCPGPNLPSAALGAAWFGAAGYPYYTAILIVGLHYYSPAPWGAPTSRTPEQSAQPGGRPTRPWVWKAEAPQGSVESEGLQAPQRQQVRDAD